VIGAMAIQPANSSNQIHGKRSSQISIAGHGRVGSEISTGLPAGRMASRCSCLVAVRQSLQAVRLTAWMEYRLPPILQKIPSGLVSPAPTSSGTLGAMKPQTCAAEKGIVQQRAAASNEGTAQHHQIIAAVPLPRRSAWWHCNPLMFSLGAAAAYDRRANATRM